MILLKQQVNQQLIMWEAILVLKIQSLGKQ